MSSHCNYYPQCFCPKKAGLYCGIGPLERIRQYQIQTIAEHSFIPSLFDWENSRGVRVLDCGCRGFEFAMALEKIGAKVECIDADKLDNPIRSYHCMALTDFKGYGYLVKSQDVQATRFQKQPITENNIVCVTLSDLCRGFMIDFWDLIKLDIEGSEYEVIMSLDKAPAKQLSIEFHLHIGIYGQAEMTMMEDKLKALGYEFVQHEASERHGAGRNYWDSLFVLR